MSDTPYRIEMIVYPDRRIEFKGDAQEIRVAKKIFLSDQHRELEKAWNDPGINQEYHEEMKYKLSQEWHPLYRAITNLLKDPK